MKRLTLSLATAAALSLSLAACGEPATDADTGADTTAIADDMTAEGPGTLVEVAGANGDFATLVAAVTAAGLGETLSGPGPFTVFAPTNAAFEKLPAGTVDGLLKPESKDALTGILTYHVVAGNVDAASLVKMIKDNGGTAELTTVNGAKLTAKATDAGVTLTDAAGNTANVTTTDVAANNGVIHVIDTVLMPG